LEYRWGSDGNGGVIIIKYLGSEQIVHIPSRILIFPVTSVDFRAFYGCNNLTSVTIPDSVTSIEERVFQGCTSLKTINVTSGNNAYSSQDGVLYNKGKNMLHTYPAGKKGVFTIPDDVNSISGWAFNGCINLTTINVTSGNNRYSSQDGVMYNKTKTVLHTYPAGKKGAFTIPNSVISIRDNAFSGCNNLTDITIPNIVTSIGIAAFEDCTSLKSITIPDTVTSIRRGAFEGCTSLKSITIPDTVTSIESFTFYGCSELTSITIPDSVTSIGMAAFEDCTSLKSITIPDTVTSIESFTFYGCSNLTNVTIPSSVTSINFNAFYGCSELTSITIPNSVTKIGDNAFYYCTSLTNVTFQGMIPSSRFNSNAFPGDLHNKYFAGGIGTYKRTSGSLKWTKQ
jgi:hypothetical protein